MGHYIRDYCRGCNVYQINLGILFIIWYGVCSSFKEENYLDTLKDFQVWVIILLSGIPVLAYHIYGIFISGVLESQLKGRFFPQMWSDPNFYLQWKNAISNVTGHYIILLIGLVGLFFLEKNRDRLFLIGIWVGYILYGFGFSYHITTHYYYTLPVIPLLAVTLGSVSDRVINLVQTEKTYSADLGWSCCDLGRWYGMGGVIGW